MSSSPKSSSKSSQFKKRSLPFRLFGRQKHAKSSPSPYSGSIEEDLALLRSPLPQTPMLSALQTQTAVTTPPLPFITSPVAYDHATSPPFPLHMPTPTIPHLPAGDGATDSDTQSLSSSENESDEYTPPPSHYSYSTYPSPQPTHTQYTYAAQNYQGGITTPTTYQAFLLTNPSNGINTNNAVGAANMVSTQTVAYQHSPQEGGYTRHCTTFAYSQSPCHQTRSYTNGSVSITGPNNVITFGSRRQTTQM